jgi:hypothetical protein
MSEDIRPRNTVVTSRSKYRKVVETEPWILKRGREAAQLLGECKWELGDLAVYVMSKVVDITKVFYVRHGTGWKKEFRQVAYKPPETLTDFANDVGMSPDSLRQYFEVSLAWPKDDRIRIRYQDVLSWSAFRKVYAREDRAEVLTAFVEQCDKEGISPTVAAMRDYLAKPPAEPAIEPPTTTEVIEAKNQGSRPKDANTPEYRVVEKLVSLDPDRLIGDARRNGKMWQALVSLARRIVAEDLKNSPMSGVK